jgi:hypothetical protein
MLFVFPKFFTMRLSLPSYGEWKICSGFSTFITSVFSQTRLKSKNQLETILMIFGPLMVLLSGSFCWSQTNPAAFALSGGNFTFTTQTATNTFYPTNIQGWNNGGTANVTTLPTVASTADIGMTASAIATTTGIGNLGANGFQFLSSGTATTVGALCVSVNATNRSNLTASWTAEDRTSGASRQMNLTLQYRVGTSGAFTTVTGGQYTTSNSSQAAASTFTNIALPSACNNQAVVQLRWIYWESPAQANSRDAIRLDDITIASVASPIVDGVITATEYGTHTNGNNQQSGAIGTWYMNWDATNLYIGIAGTNTAEGAVVYLDKNPITPVNGGANSDGNLTGNTYDGSNFSNLQFRADMVVYFKDGYKEYRTANGSGAWSAATTTFGSYASASGTREIAIPWSALGGMPAAFNWFGYVAYAGAGAYASVPTENLGGPSPTWIGSGATTERYYTVSTTTIGSATPPFSRNSYTYTSPWDISAIGTMSIYDFTMNSPGRYASRTGNVTGNWTIAGNFTIGAGTVYMGSGGSGYGTTNIAGNLNLLGGTYHMDATTAATSVTGNVIIASGATLTMSTQIGGDLNVGGSWSNLGTFTPNLRSVQFNGTLAQTLTGATTFDYLTLNNSLGLTLSNSVTVNQTLALTSGKITLGTNNLTTAGSITSSSTNYIVTNSTGQLKRTIGASAVTFPVGNTAYNPIILNNTGTSDVYGINVLDGTYTTPYDNTKVVNRRWQVSEAVSGGSNLSVVGQYNTADTFGANFTAGTTPLIGFYNGTSWTTVGATTSGANPFTYTSSANITPSNLTTGTQYIGLGKDNAFISLATKLAITAISPATPSATDAFNVTVQAQDAYDLPAAVVAGTAFSLTTNGTAGAIGGTVTGTILAATDSITVNGVTLATAGTGVTLTATRTSGDLLTAGTSSAFTVLGAPTQLAFVGVPGTGNGGVNLASFTVEARRADNSVDTNYTGTIVLTKASGTGTLSGTTSVTAVAGVATFNAVQFDLASTYTLNANSGLLTQGTSGNIVVTLVPASIFANTITGTNPGLASPYTTGQTFNSHITVSGIERGAGLTGASTNDIYNASAWSTGAIDLTDYFEFTLTPNTGYQINLSSFVYNAQVSSGTPTINFRSSVDGYTTNIGSATASGTTISLSGASYQNLTGPITFRMYGYGFATAGTTFSVNDFMFNGNVVCIQPTAFAVTGGGSYCPSDPGVAVGVANSQSDITYQLKIGGVNTGSPVAGTGATISFGLQTAAGIYTVEATNANSPCNYATTMTGNVAVALNTPSSAAVISGSTSICPSGSANIIVTITGGVSPYTLVYNDGANHTVNGYTSAANISVSPSTTTTYTIVSVTDSNGCAGSGNSGSAVVTVSGASTWTGAASTNVWTTAGNWSCGVPNSATDVTVSTASIYPEITTDVTINGLTIDSGTTLKVASGHNLTVVNAVANSGTLTIENNANLTQNANVSNTGSGTTIVKRETAALKRLDYVLWSSPVSGQQLQAFSPQTVSTRFYTFDGSLGTAGLYVAETATNSFTTGTGYLIRLPNNHPVTPTVWNGVFTGGNAHNGTYTQSSLTSNQYYAVGNPYPSTIDADLFIAVNNLTDALYFWRKTNNAANPSYATYTLAGGVGTANSADPLGLVPDGSIAVGQGFIVKTGGTSLTFNNGMRTMNNSSTFFRSINAERNRIWLNLTNTTGVFCQTLVSYMENATSGIDSMIDGHFINDTENALTSIIDNEEFAIQGRALPFDATDVVPLGFKCAAAGDYSISIDHMDGLFGTTVTDIYVKDNLTNTYHDLSVSPYTFTTEAGVFNNRFELRYENLLSVDQPALTNNNIVVYRQNQELVVNTRQILMSKVQVYDIRGRLLVEKNNINGNEVRLNSGAQNQVLLVKITSMSDEVVTKKVIN